MSESRPEPIAIVGMACRFAGAADLHAYWAMTVAGANAFGPIPADRWAHDAFFDTNRRAADKSYAPTGGFLDDVRTFPGLALGIPPRRLEVMDPQQRLGLEMALHACHDAGYRPDDLPRKTGVFMGVTATEYRTLMSARVIAQLAATGSLGTAPDDAQVLARAIERIVPSRPYSAPGVLANMIAAVIAQELDFKGPAYTVDAACASALVALHDAVIQLRAGRIDAALAGGVYLCLTPENHIAFSRIGAISGSGVCRPFDTRADGFVQGDGAGVLVLKRLADAQRDGDRIYAVLDGVAINSDGRGDGPMAPIEGGQSDVIVDAWSDARVDPNLLGYIEAHGTGTEVGDLTEFQGLQDALGVQIRGAGTPKPVIGSSKANVGHTMSAAGVAGVIRAALAIHHRTLPPMAGFDEAKPALGLEASPFRILRQAEPWDGTHRVAAVSSFGFGGTNGHCVLTDPGAHYAAPTSLPDLVALSAPDEAQLRALAGRTADALLREPEATVAGTARAWAVRSPQAWRLAVVAGTVGELVHALREVASGGCPKGCWLGQAPTEAPRVAFLYPGQGAQRVGMLRTAKHRFPVLAQALRRAEDDLDGALAVPLTELLWPETRQTPVSDARAEAEITATEHCQPVMAAVGLALTQLLSQAGVTPAVSTGHSLGEFVAAVAGGVLTARDALRFVAGRGRAMAAVTGDPGAMVAVMTDRTTAGQLLVPGAVIANINHPTQVVVSGATDAVNAVFERATQSGVKARRLDVSHAFHSPIFAALDAGPLLAEVAIGEPTGVVASGIATRPYASADEARQVFLRHATSPVDFVGALQQCREAGAELFLQVGAGGPLASFARGVVDKERVFTLGQAHDDDEGRSLLEGFAWLWTRGVPVDLGALHAGAPVTSVPPIVLPREAYWLVKDQPQIALQLTRGAPPAPAPAPAPAPVAPPVEAASAGDDVFDKVVAVIAKVSSYPRTAIQDKQALIDDLGFDSLMVADLANGLAEAFPGLGGLPQELLVNRPTVGTLVAHVRATRDGGASPILDDAPLADYAPCWRPAPWAEPPAPLGDRRIQVAGDPDRAAAVAAGLAARGACLVDDAPAVLIWVCPPTPTPLAACLAGAPIPDPAAPLIAALDAAAVRGAPCDLLVVRRTDELWSESCAGVARAVGREWTDRRAQVVHLDPGVEPARWGALLADELGSDDRSTDIRHTTTSRAVRGFEPAPIDPPWTPGPDDLALITGGTRGIGAALAARLADAGVRLLLVGRSAPGAQAAALIAAGRAVHLAVDATDRDALVAAVAPHGAVTCVVHAAGVLADGALGSVDPSAGAQARAVKVAGFVNALAAAPNARAALAIGSWSGRFGNRHQVHYAAANAQMAALAERVPGAVVAEFGPWTSSEMAASIPAAVKAALRADGVDFVGDAVGLEALWRDLTGATGVVTHGRALPWTTRARRVTERLSVATHPYLADHAIDGVPVFPLAAAVDTIAATAGLPTPFEILDLTLFTGITVRDPIDITCTVQGERAEIRAGERNQLAYRARIRPAAETPSWPAITGGAPSPLSVADFYRDITFHGPLLAGLIAVDGITDSGAHGRVRTSAPTTWIPGSRRARWAVDPLALDSAMQLSAVVAWNREQRGGTPISIRRLVQLAPLPAGELFADVHFGASPGDGDKWVGTLVLRDAAGRALLVAEDTAAELRKRADAPTPLAIKPEWVDVSKWTAVQELKIRLDMAAAVGLRNPYFTVHEGTARNTTVVGGRTLVNFSSYNYVGLSGDPRVLAATRDAVDRYGTSVSASRVASGERPFHRELERELAAAQGAEDALVFTAGHATNVSTIGHLFGKGDLILHDELVHDSALQGIKLSGAGRRGFRHDDPDHLEQILREMRPHHEKVLIVVEGVYSMDGDICALPRYVELKKKYGCMLMVDEAHSFGVVGRTGRGVAEHYGIDGREVDIWMGTLSKSLASCGGWIAGSKDLILYLRYTAPGFVYSAGLTAANGVAALTALRCMLDEPWRVLQLQDNAHRFYRALQARGVDTGPAKGASGVIPAITGNSLHALQLSGRLLDAGVNVQPIVYPAVADDASRLRFFLSSTHTASDLDETAEKVARLLDEVRRDFPVPGRPARG